MTDPSWYEGSASWLEIPVRGCNALKLIGVSTLMQVARLRESELAAMKNVGRKTITEIKWALFQHGLHLGMEEEEIALWAEKFVEEHYRNKINGIDRSSALY